MAFKLTHLALGFQCAKQMKLDCGFVHLMHSQGRSKKVWWCHVSCCRHVTSQLTWHHVFHAVTHISPQLEGKFSSVNAFSRTHLTSSIQVTELDMPLDCGYLWFMWSDSNNEGYNRQVGGSIERRVPSWSHLDTLIERVVFTKHEKWDLCEFEIKRFNFWVKSTLVCVKASWV